MQKSALRTIRSCKDGMIRNGSFWAIVRTFQAQMAKENNYYLMLCIWNGLELKWTNCSTSLNRERSTYITSSQEREEDF